MVELPQLPEPIQRKLALKWDELLETRGFTGAHLNWRLQPVSEAPPPPRTVGSHGPGSSSIVSGALQKRSAFTPAERVGVDQTVGLALERFAEVEAEYFAFWSAKPEAHSDAFVAQLEDIRTQVTDDVGKLWEKRGDWFRRVCRSEVDNGLSDLVKASTSKARREEIQRLDSQQPTIARSSSESDQPPAEALRQDVAGDGESNTNTGQPATATTGQALDWPQKLRAARKRASLSRPAVVNKLKQSGVDLTADAIKKHEEGKALPRPNARKAYAEIYDEPEDTLFPLVQRKLGGKGAFPFNIPRKAGNSV